MPDIPSKAQHTEDNLREVFFHNTTDAPQMTYDQILDDVRTYMVENHSRTISEGSEESEELVKNLIMQYLTQKKYALPNMSMNELSSKLYEYMAGLAFLRKYIYAIDTEEVDIDSWQTIWIIRQGKRVEKIPEHFASPDQALDIVRRMIAPTGQTLDNTTPIVITNLDRNIRIAAAKHPVIDEDIGVMASIRVVNQRIVTAEMLHNSGSATWEMLDFLQLCIRHGVSVCIAGATGSGKTTLLDWLLSCVPDDQRMITIEDGSRELNLYKRDEHGNVINSVQHMITRHRDGNDTLDISQDDLLEFALRMNPTVIGVGEIRKAKECMAVAEASRTGHTCATTIHANSAKDSYMRMMTLAKRENALSDEMLMKIMVEAYPIMVYTKQLADGSRRIMEITEAEEYWGDELHWHSIFKYDVENQTHQKVGGLSPKLVDCLLENGATKEELKPFMEG